MPDLLIAGTGGISFKDNHGTSLGYPLKMRIGILTGGLIGKSIDELVELLSMDHIAGQQKPVKTSLKPGTSIEPLEVLEVAYNQVPSRFQHFLYDWRADLRYNAERLRDFLTQPTPGGEKWNLVGHSQGGLLVVLASKMMRDEEAFARHIDKVILVGVPLAGTVNSAVALIEGDQFGKNIAPVFKQVVRSWPSLYQMLPAWPMVIADDEIAASHQQQTQLTGWDGHAGVQDDLFLRARDAQKMLRNPLSHMEGVNSVTLLMAKNRRTSIATKRVNSKLTSKSAVNNMGDSLVPFAQTISWIGQHISEFVHAFRSGVNEHSFMLTDPTVGTRLRSLLN